MNTANLKTELGRIRGAIMSGSFDRDTALDALNKAEKHLDAGQPFNADDKAIDPPKTKTDFFGREKPQPTHVQPASGTNPVPEQVGRPFVPGGTVVEAPHPYPATPPHQG